MSMSYTVYQLTQADIDAARSAHTGLQYRDFVRLDLSRLSFDSLQLSGVSFRQCDLTGASFRGAHLTSAFFQYCTLNGAQFDDADLTPSDFYSCDLRSATFRDAHGRGMNSYLNNWGDNDLSGMRLNNSSHDLLAAALESGNFSSGYEGMTLLEWRAFIAQVRGYDWECWSNWLRRFRSGAVSDAVMMTLARVSSAWPRFHEEVMSVLPNAIYARYAVSQADAQDDERTALDDVRDQDDGDDYADDQSADLDEQDERDLDHEDLDDEDPDDAGDGEYDE